MNTPMEPTPNSLLMDWLKQNGVTIVITLAGVIATFTVYGYRISTLEDRADKQLNRIQALEQSNNQTALALVAIQKDIEYIKLKIDRLSP